MKNTIKKMLAMIIVILVFIVIVSFNTTNGEEIITQEVISVNIQCPNIQEKIVGLELENQIDSLNTMQNTAHDMAENARALGFTEDNEIIKVAKDIWHEADNILIIKEEEYKKEQESKKINLGNFWLTAYCPCTKCCGPNAKGITATGTRATANRTIAVDPRIIPYGSTVYIEGLGTYVAEDCGGSIRDNRIDVFYNTHYEALHSGITAHSYTVYLLKD